MSFQPGATLAHYEVIELIGKGGMGEVYRAKDSKLGRDVAIKVLPEEFARDKERLDRFEREARLLAQLNHANIATLHGLEEQDGQQFLVMELVEGETLAERIAQGPLPVDEAIPLFIQIAEGLEAAHEKGIIHRDLKPANIKIGPDGKPKILDFGLAKAFVGNTEIVADSSQSPTLTKGTALGAIMGTAPYMSPEQARGKSVDRRADVWAFACILFESLTGKRAFPGETTTDVLAAIVNREPEWSLLPQETPWRIKDLLSRALRKDLYRRAQHVGDARVALSDALEDAMTEPTPSASPKDAKGWGRWVPWAVAFGALMALVTTWLSTPPPTPGPLKRFSINLPPNGVSAHRFSIAISPDGSKLVYPGGTPDQLRLRYMDRIEALPVPETEGARHPFFSPDGAWIGYFVSGEIRKVPVSGGTPVTLCKTGTTTLGATWTGRDTVLFSSLGGLYEVPASGGEARALLEAGSREGESFATWPTVLPDGDSVLYADSTGTGVDLVLLSLSSGKRRVLVKDGFTPRFVAPGYLVYQQGSSIRGVAFDPETGAVGESSVSLIEGVAFQSLTSENFAVSDEGTLVYVPGDVATSHSLVWVNRRGEARPLSRSPNSYRHPRLSPDGRRLAVRIGEYGGDAHIWVQDLTRGTLTRLTFERRNVTPIWTPDDRFVTFGTGRPVDGAIFSVPADGSGPPKKIFDRGRPSSWSPDGRVLAVTDFDMDANILLVTDGKATPFFPSPFNEGGAIFSPDGRFLAYLSDESGQYEVYVRPYGGSGGKLQISLGGGTEPAWSPDGKEIIYRNGKKMMAVPVETTPELRAGNPVMLFEGPYEQSLDADRRQYDVAPDGREFVMVQAEQGPELTQLNVILNWTGELKRLAPTH